MKTEEITYNNSKQTAERILWEIGDIGYSMGITKAKVIKIDKERGYKYIQIEYLEKSDRYEIKEKRWTSPSQFHAKMRRKRKSTKFQYIL